MTRRKFMTISLMTAVVMLTGSISVSADTIALEDYGISVEAEEYTSLREDEGFTYLYTMDDQSIPYVMIGCYKGATLPIADDFTEQIMQPEYKDLQVVEGPKMETHEGKTFESITYSYTIGDKYTVLDNRLFSQNGKNVVMFASKEVPDQDYKNPDNFLTEVADSYKPLAGGGDDYQIILGGTDNQTEAASDSEAAPSGLQVYTESDNGDGTYTYYFTDCGVSVTMSEEFYQNTRVISEIATATFVHRDSYEAYQKEGMREGGRLFTIGYSVDSEFMEYPGYSYLGFDEEECVNWYTSVPTDYTGYNGDAKIKEEFSQLNASVPEVLETIKVDGIEEKQ